MNDDNTSVAMSPQNSPDNALSVDEGLRETQLKFCASCITKMKRSPNSHPFLKPVDPIALGIPDYPDKIKHPMDISTIKNKLDTGAYAGPEEFYADVTLMFNNCFLYNHADSIVYKMGQNLQKLFEACYAEMPSVVKKRRIETPPSPKVRRTAKSPEAVTSPGVAMNVEDFARCAEILADLEKPKHKKYSWPFLLPVTEADAPGYFSIISHPMDLSTLRSKFEARQYSSLHEFVQDVNLMFENCFKYNSPETEVYRCGEEFRRAFHAALARDGSREKDADGKISELRKKISALTQELKVLEQSASKSVFTMEDRERIGKAIIQMTKLQAEKVAEIVHRHCAYEYVDNDEIEINLQTMPDEVVQEIDEFIQKTKNGEAGEASTASED